MKRTVRFLLVLAIGRLPSQLRSHLFKRLFDWDIHPTATIGLSLIDVGFLRMASGAHIGHLNVIRDLRQLRMGEKSHIGQWNWISAAVPLVNLNPSVNGALDLGRETAVTSRHYIDASGGITIGEFTTIAGVKSTIVSHQIDINSSEQTALSVAIGNFCFIGSDVRLTPGTEIPDRCVIAMGAVVAGTLKATDTLYGGVPAKAIKTIDDAQYFHREVGNVSI